VLPQVSILKRVALDLLFPPYCIGCGEEGSYICGRCGRELPYISPPICTLCGRPLLPGGSCPGCIGQPTSLDGVRAPFLFEGLIRKAVHDLKYHNLRALIPVLAGYLKEYLTEDPLPGDVLVPVPIHPKRMRERGYNQSALLARELGRQTSMFCEESCLTRLTYIAPQAKLPSAAERQQNTAGAFICKDDRLKGKRVILIDDVSTSGATMNACAIALKAAGAAAVHGLALALEL
jgi:ComF family protein